MRQTLSWTAGDRWKTGDEMIRIGLLGAGFIGQMHALTFRTAAMSGWAPRIDIALVALADQNAALAKEVGARYGFERVSDDWRDAATAPDIDLFINAGP